MNTQSEIYMIRAGLKNKDFRPGAERDAAERRLAQLTASAANTPQRPRGVLKFRRAA